MAQPLVIIEHDPTAKLWYYLDWGSLGWLQDGETITGAEWTLDGVEKVDDRIDGDITYVQVTGGTPGIVLATATCHVTTSAGNEDDRSIGLRIVDR